MCNVHLHITVVPNFV